MSEVTIEKVPYGGWPNCFRITNGQVELIVTGDIGGIVTWVLTASDSRYARKIDVAHSALLLAA